jgi:S-methylmethionine-dependent homocysteine/selenocysteine methylase
MDGGTGTELQHRGERMDDTAWCGLAHMEDPDLVRAVHEDYIRAGAEIVIANTFATSQVVLEAAGRGDEFEASNRRAVELAVVARDAAAQSRMTAPGASAISSQLSQNLDRDPRVCVMAVDSGKRFWLASVAGGRFTEPPALPVHLGTMTNHLET